MTRSNHSKYPYLSSSLVVAAFLGTSAGPAYAQAAPGMPGSSMKAGSSMKNGTGTPGQEMSPDLRKHLAEMYQKTAECLAKTEKPAQDCQREVMTNRSAAPASAGAPPGMAGDPPAPMAGCCMDKMGKMPAGAMPMPGAMPKAQGTPMPAATAQTQGMPDFPGNSHIYHVGSTGFFLNHPDTIVLDANQKAALGRIKDKAMAEQAAMQLKIDQAEREIWQLTASDRPALNKIDGKVRAVGTLNGDQRIAFIRAVGEAARVLTPDQRAAVLGNTTPGAQAMTPSKEMPGEMKGMNKPMGKDKKKPMKNDKAMPGKPMPMDDDTPMPVKGEDPMPMKHDKPMGGGHM